MRHLSNLFFVAVFLTATSSYADEKKGIDWIAFPTFEGNTDAGFVFGAQGSVIDYGPSVRTEGQPPFKWETLLKLSYSTRNRHDHRLIFDAPDLLGRDLELFSQVEFVHIADANWFGVGTTDVDDQENYRYRLTEPGVEASLAKRFATFFRAGVGLKFLYSDVSFEPDAKIEQDSPPGIDGERNFIGVAFVGFDQTDDAFSPREGARFEGYIKGTTTPISRHSWGGFGFAGSGYVPLFYRDLVFAQRVAVETLHGSVPISQLVRLGGSRTFRSLGGVFSQRGFPESRFAGPTKFLSNSELRFYFPPLFDSLVFGLGGFTDVSKVIQHTELNPSYGGELTIGWKGAFLFRIDYGVSREGGEFYIEGRHIF